MSAAADLTALLARAEAATGPDRELDALIWWRFARRNAERVYWTAAMGMPRDLGDEKPSGLGWLAVQGHASPVTSSLDAALALCERVLPGWRNIIDSDGMRDGVHLGRPLACVFTNQFNLDEPFFDAAAPTRALALLAAMLKALIAKGDH